MVAPINPTQLTPPRVALIDERSGAISREWYRFFLSLLTATQTNQQETELAPAATSLLAAYDAMLASLAQASETASNGMITSLENSLINLQNAFGVTPPDLGGTVTSVNASGGTTGLTFSGGPITSSGTLTLSGTLAVANGGTGVTTSTGTGSVVLSNSPTLVTPTLGACSATSIANGLGAVGTPSYTFTGDLNTGMWSPAADTIAFSEGGAEIMRIDSSGNLLVGKTITDLEVSGFVANATGMSATNANAEAANFNRQSSDGDLVIFRRGETQVGSVTVTTTTTTYNVTSDARLKHNIVDAPEASDLIDAIKVRSFKWNADDSEQRYGFVAQELIEVAPEAVSVPQYEDQMMGVDYSKLVPMLVKEAQSLRARVDELERPAKP